MRIIYKLLIIVLFFFDLSFYGQEKYRSTDQIKEEWVSHTSYQKDEMISFSDFLFNEGYYERCLAISFQYLYHYPEDPLKSTFLYRIARCYESMKNYSLARRYYNRVLNIESKESYSFKASKYREIFCYLMEGDDKSLLEETKDSKDPYFLVLRGYSYFQNLNWEEARALFISAEEQFNHRHYTKLMLPLYQAIENVSKVPQHSKSKVALSGMVLPGGGQMALNEWKNGQGILGSALIFYYIYILGKSNNIKGPVYFSNSIGLVTPEYNSVNNNFILSGGKLAKSLSSESSFLKYTAPPIVFGSFLYIVSLYKSFKDIQKKNKSLVQFYAIESLQSISPERFLDFKEPSFSINNSN